MIFQQLNLSPMAITRSPHLWPPSHPGRRDLLWTDCWTCWRGQSQTPPMKTTEGMCATQPLPPFKTTLYNPVLHHYKIINSCIRNTYHRARPLCVFMLLYEPPSTITVYYNHIPPSVTSYNNHPLIMYR